MRGGVVLGACLLAAPVSAQQRKIVDGVVINMGLVPAAEALRADGHREAHSENQPSGAQHILVTLADSKTGARIGNARIMIEVLDPKGHAEAKALITTRSAGVMDYSEMFSFGWSGKYRIRVIVTLKGAPKAIEAQFTHNHVV